MNPVLGASSKFFFTGSGCHASRRRVCFTNSSEVAAFQASSSRHPQAFGILPKTSAFSGPCSWEKGIADRQIHDLFRGCLGVFRISFCHNQSVIHQMIGLTKKRTSWNFMKVPHLQRSIFGGLILRTRVCSGSAYSGQSCSGQSFVLLGPVLLRLILLRRPQKKGGGPEAWRPEEVSHQTKWRSRRGEGSAERCEQTGGQKCGSQKGAGDQHFALFSFGGLQLPSSRQSSPSRWNSSQDQRNWLGFSRQWKEEIEDRQIHDLFHK